MANYTFKNAKHDGSKLYHISHAEVVDTNTDGVSVQGKIDTYDAHVSNTSNPHNVTLTQLGYDQAALIKTVINTMYPVGSIKMSYNKVNPGTYLSGTTWVLESQGRYLLGCNNSATGPYTGGSWTINIAHNHGISSHAHTINSHAHSINAHSHTVNNHVHSTGNHTLTIDEMPIHYHSLQSLQWVGAGQGNTDLVPNAGNNVTGERIFNTHLCGGGGAHNHGNTGGSAPGTSGTALTTNGSGALTSNGSGDLCTWSSCGDITIQPPYLAIFVWRRTA